MSKTGRKRGQIYRMISSVAEFTGGFTVNNLMLVLTRNQASRNCNAMVKSGYLRVILPGTPGHNGRPTLYAPFCADARNGAKHH